MRQNKRLALTNQTWPLGGNAEKIWAVFDASEQNVEIKQCNKLSYS